MDKIKNDAKNLGNGALNAGKTAGSGAKSWITDFKTFIDKGNVVDLAVGIVLGTAFTAIVTSIVKDIITPIIGLIQGSNMENSFVFLKKPAVCSPGATLNSTACAALTTPTLAQNAGGLTLNWGSFIQAVINFILIALIVFFLVKMYTAAFRRKKPAPKTKDCPYCCEQINLKAIKCPNCASELESSSSGMNGIMINNSF